MQIQLKNQGIIVIKALTDNEGVVCCIRVDGIEIRELEW